MSADGGVAEHSSNAFSVSVHVSDGLQPITDRSSRPALLPAAQHFTQAPRANSHPVALMNCLH
jgi:hypothetical protein